MEFFGRFHGKSAAFGGSEGEKGRGNTVGSGASARCLFVANPSRLNGGQSAGDALVIAYTIVRM